MSKSKRDKAQSGYIPSPPAAFVGVFLSIGIVALAMRDSFTTDYDARATIAIMSVLIGGVFGFDYRRGRWQGEPAVNLEKSPTESPGGEPR